MPKQHENNGASPPDGGYGWVIIFATTMINICVLPLVQCFGIIFENEFKTLGINAAQTSFLLHLHSAIFCSLGLLGSPLLKKYSYRAVALFGTTLMCLGIFLTSFAQSYAVLICTISILVGIGQGILLPATYQATNTYFKKKLTIAISLSVTGSSLSSIFMPQLCNFLLIHFGRFGTVLILSGISVIAVLCCILLKPLKRNQQQQQQQQYDSNDGEALECLNGNHQKDESNQVYNETTIPAKKHRDFFNKLHDLFNLELLKYRPYVIAIIGMSISYASELNIILMIPFILPELAQFERSDVATVMSIQSIADIIGRLFVPIIGHNLKISPIVMYANSLITSTIGRTVMAICYNSKLTIFCCAVLLGIAKGTKAVYQSVIIPKFVPLEKLPAANGLNMLLTGGLSLVIGPIIGLIHDKTNSYTYALHAASILSMSCVLLWIINYYWYKDTTDSTEK